MFHLKEFEDVRLTREEHSTFTVATWLSDSYVDADSPQYRHTTSTSLNSGICSVRCGEKSNGKNEADKFSLDPDACSSLESKQGVLNIYKLGCRALSFDSFVSLLSGHDETSKSNREQDDFMTISGSL